MSFEDERRRRRFRQLDRLIREEEERRFQGTDRLSPDNDDEWRFWGFEKSDFFEKEEADPFSSESESPESDSSDWSDWDE